jgi:hypothetical protein
MKLTYAYVALRPYAAITSTQRVERTRERKGGSDSACVSRDGGGVVRDSNSVVFFPNIYSQCLPISLHSVNLFLSVTPLLHSVAFPAPPPPPHLHPHPHPLSLAGFFGCPCRNFLFAWKICRLHFLIDISQSGAFSAGGSRHITGA